MPAGVEWTSRSSAADNEWTSVAWGGTGAGTFVAVSRDGSGNRVMTSPDGINWTSRTSAADSQWQSVAWGGAANPRLFVAVAEAGPGARVMTSPDGIVWTPRPAPANDWRSVTWGGPGPGTFVAVARSGQVMTSPDGLNWTSRSSVASSDWRSVTWGGPGPGTFVAVAAFGQVMTSPDGITWTSRTSAANHQWLSVAWGGPTGQQVFVAVAATGFGNRVMTSPDGIAWTLRASAADEVWRSVVWGGPAGEERFVAVARTGTGNRVMTSPDGIAWTTRPSAADIEWFSVTWGGPRGSEAFVAVAETGTGNRVMTSSAQSCPPPPRIPPGPPIDVVAESSLLGARVSWKAPLDPGTDSLTLYAVRSWPGGPVCQVSASITSCDVGGLDPELDYHFTVVPMSGAGWGTPSEPSNTVRPLARRTPGVPTAVMAFGGDQQATVSWQAPADEGTSPIDTYRVTASPGGATCQSTNSPCTVTGLTNGAAYSFAVEARNAQGWGTLSASSPAVTPNPPALVIAGSRGGRVVALAGNAVSFMPGIQLSVWTGIGDDPAFVRGTSSPVVDAGGTFTWQRRLNPSKTIRIYVEHVDTRSNEVILRGRSD